MTRVKMRRMHLFKEIAVGSWFLDADEELLIKTAEASSDDTPNAIFVTGTGGVVSLSADYPVIAVDNVTVIPDLL